MRISEETISSWAPESLCPSLGGKPARRPELLQALIPAQSLQSPHEFTQHQIWLDIGGEHDQGRMMICPLIGEGCIITRPSCNRHWNRSPNGLKNYAIPLGEAQQGLALPV